MKLTVNLPEEVVEHLGPDAERGILEAVVVQQFREGKLGKPELRRILDLATVDQLDGLLKAHGVFYDYTFEDIERDRKTLKRLGF